MATNNAINLKTSGIVSYDGAGVFSALANPLTVAHGGTGVSSNTAYAVLCAGTTTTNPVQSIAGVGTTGQVLLSNGAGALPTFQGTSLGVVARVSCATGTPGDGATYFLGNGSIITGLTTSGNPAGIYFFPIAGTINTVYGAASLVGAGSNENVTVALRLNNTTDYNVTTTLQLTSSPQTFNNTSLNLPISIGDYIEFKLVCPTWVTNPTSVAFSISALLT